VWAPVKVMLEIVMAAQAKRFSSFFMSSWAEELEILGFFRVSGFNRLLSMGGRALTGGYLVGASGDAGLRGQGAPAPYRGGHN